MTKFREIMLKTHDATPWGVYSKGGLRAKAPRNWPAQSQPSVPRPALVESPRGSGSRPSDPLCRQGSRQMAPSQSPQRPSVPPREGRFPAITKPPHEVNAVCAWLCVRVSVCALSAMNHCLSGRGSDVVACVTRGAVGTAGVGLGAAVGAAVSKYGWRALRGCSEVRRCSAGQRGRRAVACGCVVEGTARRSEAHRGETDGDREVISGRRVETN